MTIGTPPILSGPIAPESNPPINPQYFNPSQFFISAITLGFPTVVTTTVNNNYVIGQQVRLLIPPQNGCRQLNEQAGYVLALPASNQVSVSINSVGIDAFVSTSLPNQPQIIAIGDINSGLTSTNGKLGSNNNFAPTVPGAFINISP